MMTEHARSALMTVDQVAAILQVKKSWIYAQTRLRGNERLPHTRVGRYVRFTQENIEAILKKWEPETAQ
jgi:excisionase family DNA binding protein